MAIDQAIFTGDLQIGMLGGGQLGKMLLQSAIKFNLSIHVLDPSPEAPCSNFCQRFVTGDFADYDTVYDFGRDLDVVTIEIEHVNVDALEQLESEGIRVHPSPRIIRLVQDKGLQKEFYGALGVPTAEFHLLESRASLEEHLDFLPAAQKLRRGGYDGKGVVLIDREDFRHRAFDAPSVLERRVDIAKELSFIVARNPTGESVCYPAVEMVFHPELNMVDFLASPAEIPGEIAERGQAIASRIAAELDLVGLLAVEMFLNAEGELLVNEIAPRPHNSGHHSIEANVTSQFEQHLRAILDLPLGDTSITFPSVMLNLVGSEGHSGRPKYRGMEELLRTSGAYPHLYGKAVTKPGRKMGHVTIVDQTLEGARSKAARLRDRIGVEA